MSNILKGEQDYLSEGQSLRIAGNLPAALEILKAGLFVGRDSPVYNFKYALMLKEAGMLTDAITFFRRCKRSPIAYNQIAECYLALGDIEEAINNYNRSISRDQFDSAPEIALGDIYVTKGEVLSAIKHYQNALAKNPGRMDTMKKLEALLSKR